jgi:predicted  nucleic acid-binding Zn-ribbon protein
MNFIFELFLYFRNKKQERKDLSHELKHAAQVIKHLNDECNKLMVEKFGKLVQLEKLESAIVNLQIEELKQRLDDAGDEYYNTMAQYEVG